MSTAEILAQIEKNKKKTLMVILALLLVVTVAFGLFFAKNNAVIAEERDSLTATGTIEAKTVTAAFKIPGKIDAMPVEEGSKVEEGQHLATLENNQLMAKYTQAQGAYEAALSQAEQAGSAVALTEQQVEATISQLQAKVAQAEVGLTDAQQMYDRISRLHQAEAVSDKDYDQAKNNLELAKNQLLEAQAGLDQALASRTQVQVAQAQYQAALGQQTQALGALEEIEATLEDAVLKAPAPGYITQKYLEAGEMVNAGTPVFQITDLERPYVKVFISEEKIGRVQLNQEAEIRVPAFPDKVFKGKVVWINDAGDFAVRRAVSEQHQRDLRSFEVRIDIPNEDLLLKVGMTATVKLVEGEK
ncbi:HlyD family secretion protein [Desulfofalx alkaliphila]|uniref:HlyD family secretion protein n=1 Tax=Desulfofalx alkaliphila TaxID=105483 RepID=UPI0004E0B7D9|nr:efflux RND transporter periplasmic adaptor subunit [Desulfofalx alkaliphila]